MKIILLNDVDTVGKKWDVKDVADGYARNYLLPRGLAKPATDSALKEIEKRKQDEAKRAEEELKSVQELASKIDGLELTLTVKAEPGGTLFGSMNEQKIAEALQALGHQITRSQIQLQLDNPIKALGEYAVTVSFPHGLEAQLKIIVEGEPTPSITDK